MDAEVLDRGDWTLKRKRIGGGIDYARLARMVETTTRVRCPRSTAAAPTRERIISSMIAISLGYQPRAVYARAIAAV
jgi:hypothetical protein